MSPRRRWIRTPSPLRCPSSAGPVGGGGAARQTSWAAARRARPNRAESAPPAHPARAAGRARLISLDFKDADVVNIVRVLAAESGMNIVIGDDVKGKISIALHNVPWEQALDAILAAKGLEKVERDGVIRIVSQEQRDKEREARARADEAARKAEAEIRAKAAEAHAREIEARAREQEAPRRRQQAEDEAQTDGRPWPPHRGHHSPLLRRRRRSGQDATGPARHRPRRRLAQARRRGRPAGHSRTAVLGPLRPSAGPATAEPGPPRSSGEAAHHPRVSADQHALPAPLSIRHRADPKAHPRVDRHPGPSGEDRGPHGDPGPQRAGADRHPVGRIRGQERRLPDPRRPGPQRRRSPARRNARAGPEPSRTAPSPCPRACR